MVAAGALTSLAFPEPDITFLAWIGVAPLLWAARAGGARRGAWLGFVYGLGFFGALLIWIKYVGWIAWGALTILQAGFLALFGAMWALLTRRFSGAVTCVLGAAAWVAIEYVRQEFPVVGFPWGQLAQSHHDHSWLLRVAAWGGGWAVAFLLLLVNGLVAEARSGRTLKRRIRYVGAAVLVLAAPALLPANGSSDEGRMIRVAIVQGNVPRVFSGTIAEKNIAILNSHVSLTKTLAEEAPDLIVWPESAVGLDMARVPVVRSAVEEAARAGGTEMIVGGNEDAGAGYKVLAYHLGPNGEVIDTYQKTHLVPFGEYVPWRGALEWIPMLDQVSRDAVPGTQPKVFETDAGPVAAVVSFEGDFGSLVRRRIGREGGRLLVVATNTSTWATSWASAQHLAFSQVRAAETGVYVVHAALSGISAFIRPDGSVISSTDLWKAETLVEEVSMGLEPTFYARWGDWLAWLSLIAVLVALALSLRRRPGSVP